MLFRSHSAGRPTSKPLLGGVDDLEAAAQLECRPRGHASSRGSTPGPFSGVGAEFLAIFSAGKLNSQPLLGKRPTLGPLPGRRADLGDPTWQEGRPRAPSSAGRPTSGRLLGERPTLGPILGGRGDVRPTPRQKYRHQGPFSAETAISGPLLGRRADLGPIPRPGGRDPGHIFGIGAELAANSRF